MSPYENMEIVYTDTKLQNLIVGTCNEKKVH